MGRFRNDNFSVLGRESGTLENLLFKKLFTLESEFMYDEIKRISFIYLYDFCCRAVLENTDSRVYNSEGRLK